MMLMMIMILFYRQEEETANQGHVHTDPGEGAGEGFPADPLPRRQHQRAAGLGHAPHRGPDPGRSTFSSGVVMVS